MQTAECHILRPAYLHSRNTAAPSSAAAGTVNQSPPFRNMRLLDVPVPPIESGIRCGSNAGTMQFQCNSSAVPVQSALPASHRERRGTPCGVPSGHARRTFRTAGRRRWPSRRTGTADPPCIRSLGSSWPHLLSYGWVTSSSPGRAAVRKTPALRVRSVSGEPAFLFPCGLPLLIRVSEGAARLDVLPLSSVTSRNAGAVLLARPAPYRVRHGPGFYPGIA
jgi:hypothetical protein